MVIIIISERIMTDLIFVCQLYWSDIQLYGIQHDEAKMGKATEMLPCTRENK